MCRYFESIYITKNTKSAMVRYSYRKESLHHRVRKFTFFKNDVIPFTFSDFVTVFKVPSNSYDFLQVFIRSLKEANGELVAYLWECPPVTSLTMNRQQFQFVVTEAPQLAEIRQNYSSFMEHFRRHKNVCSFTNLGRDATLVVPIPQPGLDFKNLSHFTKNATLETQYHLWARVARELSLGLKNGSSPKWVSTNGLGVYYLHIRIDDHPKYYSFEKYAKWPYTEDEFGAEHSAGQRNKANVEESNWEDPSGGIPSNKGDPMDIDPSNAEWGEPRQKNVNNDHERTTNIPTPVGIEPTTIPNKEEIHRQASSSQTSGLAVLQPSSGQTSKSLGQCPINGDHRTTDHGDSTNGVDQRCHHSL